LHVGKSRVAGQPKLCRSKRFWRGPGEGAGLGLAIVSETMRAHRGGVSVADNPGGGAMFTLSFPSSHVGDPKMSVKGFAGGSA